MTTIHVQLDEATYQRAKRAAEAAGRTIEQLAAEALAEKAAAEPAEPPRPAPGSVIGMWADDPEAVDEMLKTVMQMRLERDEALLRRIDELGDAIDRA